MKKNIFSFIFLLSFICVKGQEQFSVSVVPSAITAMPSVHSGAFAQWDGKWIFIGGRKEGLHNFQAGIAFSPAGRNDSVFVVDPVANVRWGAYLGNLSANLFESLCSSNMEYYQDSTVLYMMGGFGRQNANFTWVTFPVLNAVDLPGLTSAVINGSPIAGYFRQITDTTFAVAGGGLEKIDSTYYLVFGQQFEGIYNDGSSPIFTQHYTAEVRKLTIHDDGSSLSFSNYSAEQDTDNFHRRDYNLVKQIFPDGSFGFTAFGGVFHKEANIPYLTPIDIHASSSYVNSSFDQNLNQYTAANMPVYDSTNNFMHTIFFGGMSFYTYDIPSQTLTQDSLVPFIKTISKVSRDGSGVLSEYGLPVEMPSLIGTNALFIPNDSVSLLHKNIINLNHLSGNTRVGWIVSGIQSDEPNISGLDPASMSRANLGVYDVYIDKSPNAVPEVSIKNSINNLLIYPNPSHGIFKIEFSLNEKSKTEVSVFNSAEKKISSVFEGTAQAGVSRFIWDGSRMAAGTYFCRIKSGDYTRIARMVLEK